MPGTCYQCGAAVAANEGQLIKNIRKRRHFVALVYSPGQKWLVRCNKCASKPAKTPPAMPTAAHNLTLNAVRRTTQRLWNNCLITAEEKRLAAAYLEANSDDMAKLYNLNKRMGQLIEERTPLHQRTAA